MHQTLSPWRVFAAPGAIGAIVLALTAAPASGAGLMIDDFVDGLVSLDVVAPGTSTLSMPAASVPGGTRSIEVVNTGLGLTHVEVVGLDVYIETVLDVADTLTPSVVTLGYNTSGAGDFSAYDAFEVAFDELQFEAGGALSAEIRVSDAGGSASRALVLNTEIIDNAVDPDVTYSFPFSEFTGAPIDWSNLTRIEVVFDTLGNENVDYRIESIAAVPEPSAWWLLALGAGAAFRRRRHAA